MSKLYRSYQDILEMEKKKVAPVRTDEQLLKDAKRYREALQQMAAWDPETTACKIARKALGLPKIEVILSARRKLTCG